MIQIKLPILICCYGDYPEITLTNINKILSLASNPSCLQIHVGMNSCGNTTTTELRKLYDSGKIQTLIECRENRNKDPMMRVLVDHVDDGMYFAWFDDDSYPTVKGWDQKVLDFINNNQPFDVAGFVHVTNRNTYDGYIDFLKQRPWFKSWDLFEQASDQNLKTNAVFAHGAFWVGNASYLRKHNFPDRNMIKKTDDMLLGEMVAQTGGILKSIPDMWDLVIAVNKGPRRGVGENSDDGWKNPTIDNDPMRFNGLTIYPTGGMCNRLRNIITAYELCKENSVPLRLLWERSVDQVANINLSDYWNIPKSIVYECYTTNKIMEVHECAKIRRNLFVKIPKNQLVGAYHNHWGLTTLEGESVETDGLKRLISGLKSDVLPLKNEWASKVNDFVERNDIVNCIGIHMRSFEFLFGERKPEQIQSLIHNFLVKTTGASKYFIATDSKVVQDTFAGILGDRCLVWKPVVKDFLSRESIEDFEHGLMDYYILSRCKKVFGTKGSSYSHLAGLLAGDLEWIAGARDTKDWEG